jgi:hypothetical protein
MFGRISQTGSFTGWMGRAFEYLCIEHAAKISKILGFSGIEFTFGPYFNAPKKDSSGVQIDLLFDRNDNVMTLCEMKYSLTPVGIGIIEKIARKAEILQNKFKNKSIQKVLISRSGPTDDLIASGFFYRIIRPDEFF